MDSKKEILISSDKANRTTMGIKELSRPVRLIIFVVLVGLSIVMAGDNGVVSSCSEEIKRDLKLSEAEYGLYGSLPGSGRIFGSLIFMVILTIFDNRKYITIACLVLNGGIYYMYYLTKNKYVIYGIRFIIGIARIYPQIFNDMWVNQFGVQKLKTLMLTTIKISSPLGQSFGYTVGTFIPNGDYVTGFAIIGTSILSVGAVLFFCPAEYFHAKYGFVGYMDQERVVSKPNERTGNSYFEDGKADGIKQKKGGSILNILVNGSYLSSLYVRANCIFIFQVIHLNIKSYAVNVLGVKDKNEIFKYYVPASAMGPTIGGLLGGVIASAVGGYQSPNSAYYILVTSILTLVSILPVAYSSSIKVLGISLFGLFFFASAMFCVTEGWAQKALPKEHDGAGSSFKMFLSSILANTLGPIVYGFLHQKFKATHPSLAWKITMSYQLLGFISAIFAVILNYKSLSKSNKKPLGNDVAPSSAKPLKDDNTDTTPVSAELPNITGDSSKV